MKDGDIEDNDILVIDKPLEGNSDNLAVCYIDEEFTVKQIQFEKRMA